MQRWNKQLILSFIFISSSPSRDSSFPSRYSKFTCQDKGKREKPIHGVTEDMARGRKLLHRWVNMKRRLEVSGCFWSLVYYLHEEELLPKPRTAFTGIFCLKENVIPVTMATVDTKYGCPYSNIITILGPGKQETACRNGPWDTPYILPQFINGRACRGNSKWGNLLLYRYTHLKAGK